MKKLGWALALIMILAADGSEAFTANGNPQTAQTKKRAGARAQTEATRKEAALKEAEERAKVAEQRAQMAEERAQAAEAAAAQAASDARAAQEQAAQALAAARRASDTLARMQETLARIEQAGQQAAADLAASKKTEEQLTVDVKAAHAAGEMAAQKADAVDKRTEGALTSTSKFPVKLYGSILVNSTFEDRGSNNADIPLFAQKRGSAADQNHQNFNMTVRQTRFGLRYEGRAFSDAKLTSVFEFDLFGGKPAFPNGAHFDLFRLRLAYGRLDWTNHSLEIGQDWAVFSPLNPTTIASYAIPGFATSGNLWYRLPQLRYEHRRSVGEQSRFIFTAALLDPNAGDHSGNPGFRTLGLGERGALPAIESRLGLTTLTHGKESSFGVSGHYSRQLGVSGSPAGTQRRSPIDSYGVGGDGSAWLSSGVRVSGEAFHGRALGVFSGQIAQTAAVIGGRARGINSTGGWVELHVEAPTGYDGPWKKLSANTGYGIEDNREQDLLAGLRKRNQTFMINGQYKLSPNMTFALEYRRVLTDWFLQPAANQKLNWASLALLYSF
jgi:hypothetical protein